VHSATQRPLQSTLGSLSQLASQLAANFALHAALTLIGVHMTSQLALGGTTVHSARASRLMSPQSERSAACTIVEAPAIPRTATALTHDTQHILALIMAALLRFDANGGEQKACQSLSAVLNTARRDQ
jgi:hypothetical protein